MPALPSNVRAGRVAALLLALQTAKGTPISDFSSSVAVRPWTLDAEVDLAALKSDAGGFMTEAKMPTAARHSVPEAAEGGISVEATPASVEWLFRSNWGEYAGFEFQLDTQVPEWLTIGWVESIAAGSTQKFTRIYDAWCHRLRVSAGLVGPVRIDASYAAEQDSDPQDLDALSGITLPGDYTPDQNVFPGRTARLWKDPYGDNVELSLHGIEIAFDQGLHTDWDMMRGLPLVAKRGFPGPTVDISFEAHVGDETWEILDANRAGTKAHYRFLATSLSPVRRFQIDLYDVDFEIEPLGHVGQGYRKFRAAGRAHLDSSGRFVTITLI